MGLLRALTINRAFTDPGAEDPRLRGRSYAVPFAQVWAAALEIAQHTRGWTVVTVTRGGGDRRGGNHAAVEVHRRRVGPGLAGRRGPDPRGHGLRVAQGRRRPGDQRAADCPVLADAGRPPFRRQTRKPIDQKQLDATHGRKEGLVAARRAGAGAPHPQHRGVPSGATALQIGFAPNVEALNAHPEPELIVAIVATLEDGQDIPPRSLEKVATAVRVLDRLNLPGGTIQTTLQGLKRIHLDDVRFEDGFYTARVRAVEETPLSPDAAEPVVEHILTTVAGLAAKVERVPDEVPRILRMNLGDPGRFADLAATLCNLKLPDRDAVLQELNVARRLDLVLASLEQAWERAREVEAVAGEESPAAAEASRRSARDRTAEIRRRIQSLQAELGELDPLEREADEVLRKVEVARLPQRVAAAARREAERLRSSTTTAQEAAEIRAYMDALIAIPWTRRAGDGKIDLAAVEEAFAQEHLGMDESKERLLEVLAVAELRGDLRGPIPCIVGPAGGGQARRWRRPSRAGWGGPWSGWSWAAAARRSWWAPARTRSGAQMGKLDAAHPRRGGQEPRLPAGGAGRAGAGERGGRPGGGDGGDAGRGEPRGVRGPLPGPPLRPVGGVLRGRGGATSTAFRATCATTSSRSASPATRRRKRSSSPATGCFPRIVREHGLTKTR